MVVTATSAAATVVVVVAAEPAAMLSGFDFGVVDGRGVGDEQAAATKLSKLSAVIFTMREAYTAAQKLLDRNSVIALLPLYSNNALRDA